MKLHGECEKQQAHLSWAPCVLYMHRFCDGEDVSMFHFEIASANLSFPSRHEPLSRGMML